MGDTQLEFDLALPSDLTGASLSFIVIGPGGSSPGHKLLIEAAQPEKEPNNGFRQTQRSDSQP